MFDKYSCSSLMIGLFVDFCTNCCFLSQQQLLALRRDHQRIQDRLQASQELRSQNKDESRTIAVLRKTNEDLSARLLKEKGSKQEKLVDLENCQQEVSNRPVCFLLFL